MPSRARHQQAYSNPLCSRPTTFRRWDHIRRRSVKYSQTIKLLLGVSTNDLMTTAISHGIDLPEEPELNGAIYIFSQAVIDATSGPRARPSTIPPTSLTNAADLDQATRSSYVSTATQPALHSPQSGTSANFQTVASLGAIPKATRSSYAPTVTKLLDSSVTQFLRINSSQAANKPQQPSLSRSHLFDGIIFPSPQEHVKIHRNVFDTAGLTEALESPDLMRKIVSPESLKDSPIDLDSPEGMMKTAIEAPMKTTSPYNEPSPADIFKSEEELTTPPSTIQNL